MPERTWLDICNELAALLKQEGIIIRNRVTKVTVKSGEDIYNFSSHGELFHIYDWWDWLCPGHHMDGTPRGPIRS